MNAIDRQTLQRIVDRARSLGAEYADVRLLQTQEETLTVKNGAVVGIVKTENEGFGVRVLKNGAWGFSCSPELSQWEKVAAEAVRVAEASARSPRDGGVKFPPRPAIDAVYQTPFTTDPFSISLEQKLEVMLKADAQMREVPEVKIAMTLLGFFKQTKYFANSEGSFLRQDLMESGGGIECTTVGEGEVQKRSYPNSFGRNQLTGGWELITAMDLPGNARRIADEAAALLTAQQCPSEITSLILDPTQLALQIHESCGHAVELDRVYGMEASFAGSSFLTTDKVGTFRYGSDIVNLYQDGTILNGLGTYGFDDDGVPTCRTDLVKSGIFQGYLSNRETAADLGAASTGANRATTWHDIPIVRMTNVNLAPGTWNFDDLIADTADGIYMITNKSWSIDDKRVNFQFGTELAYEIKKGKVGRMLKNPTYTGITYEFWRNCDAICNEKFWRILGTPNCGKGQPMQTARVGHCCSPTRFRNVRVGVTSC